MSDKKISTFIDKLSSDLTPVVPYWSAEKRGILWLAVHGLWIFLAMYLVLPFDIVNFQDLAFDIRIFEGIIYFISIIILGYCSFLGLVPGATKPSSFKFFMIPLIILVILLSYRIFGAAPYGTARSFCEFEIMAYSLGPLLHFYLLIKKGSFFVDKVTFLAMGLCSALIPTTIMHFVCVYDYKHIMIFHMLPVLLVSALSFYIFSYIKD